MSLNQQVIVTGATGFIGSQFVEYLLKNKVDVLALGRRKFSDLPNHVRLKIGSATYINIDMNSIKTLDKELSRVGWKLGDDCIFFNLAWGGLRTLSDLDVNSQFKNVYYSVNALEVAKKIGCKLFIQVGTMEEAFTNKYLELDFRVNSEFNRHLIYSAAKITAKNALKLKATQFGIDLIYVLHSHVIGAYDNKDSFLQVTLQKLINGDDLVFSSGAQLFDVISNKDCAHGYYLICKSGVPGSDYWVGSGNPRTLREYVERMAKLVPPKKSLKFGELPFNDIILKRCDFSIENLVEHTGYFPSMTYEQTVLELLEFLRNKS